MRALKLKVVPATRTTWSDVQKLFGARGACAGCWCQFPRIPRADYEAGKGAKNKARLKKLVDGETPPGLIGYVGKAPVAWIALAPREEFVRLKSSKVSAPLDDKPVWSIVCLFVDKEWRRKGLSVQMIDGACRWAKQQGATIVEAYPVDTKAKRSPDAFVWWGTASAFEAAGFEEVARRSSTRPLMRRDVSAREALDE